MRKRGLLAYLQLSTAELMRYRCLDYELLLDDTPLQQQAMLVAFANGRQYGNRLFIAPGARLDDGLLEVVVVDRLPLTTIALRLPALFRGTLRTSEGVTMRAARRVQIRAQDAIPFHVDGEPRLGERELMVECLPGALHVRVPTNL
jgi:diacylglycerol kinase (ATP)